ncbi:hypothetical protein SXCC_02706 [Gluconacetobacter sp. SXCC-1]|nr:hypothetical protein SXCC_02706 [Gluconacetobacter sp. SXCC-1]
MGIGSLLHEPGCGVSYQNGWTCRHEDLLYFLPCSYRARHY